MIISKINIYKIKNILYICDRVSLIKTFYRLIDVYYDIYIYNKYDFKDWVEQNS